MLWCRWCLSENFTRGLCRWNSRLVWQRRQGSRRGVLAAIDRLFWGKVTAELRQSKKVSRRHCSAF